MDLTPELLALFQEAVNTGKLTIGNPGARSPMLPRQLHNLLLKPTKLNPRPTFFWSAETPYDLVEVAKTTQFPMLMWQADTGMEITVTSAKQRDEKLSFGYTLTPPAHIVIDPMDVIRAQFESLSAEDQAAIVASQKQDRIASLLAKVNALPQDKAEALFAMAETEKPKKGKTT